MKMLRQKKSWHLRVRTTPFWMPEFLTENYKDAVEKYDKVLKEQPDNQECMYNLANSYYEMDELDEAQKLFEKCIESDKENVDAYLAKIPESSRPGLPTTLAGRCNEKNLALLEEFFADRDEVFAASLNRQVENLRSCIDSRNYNADALMEFLARYE